MYQHEAVSIALVLVAHFHLQSWDHDYSCSSYTENTDELEVFSYPDELSTNSLQPQFSNRFVVLVVVVLVFVVLVSVCGGRCLWWSLVGVVVVVLSLCFCDVVVLLFCCYGVVVSCCGVVVFLC